VNYEDPAEVMESLTGHSIVEWGRDETMYHLTLDDGRILIFVALGLVLPDEHALH